MKLGITLPQSGKSATKENILKVAQIALNARLASLWAFERLLWPLKPQTPYPVSPDGQIPEDYQVIFDQLLTLGLKSAKTSSIKLRTCILDILFYKPVILAKSLATLDNMSDVRPIDGFGLGWKKDKFQASNFFFKKKGKRYDALIGLVKSIWTDGFVIYRQVFYNIPSSKKGPKPKSELKPCIPFSLGGFISQSLSRVVKFNTKGWLGDAIEQCDIIEKTVKLIESTTLELCKNLDNFRMILLGNMQIIRKRPDNHQIDTAPQRQLKHGSIDQVGNDIEYLNSIGVDHLITNLIFGQELEDIVNTMDKAQPFGEFAKA